MTQPLRFRQIHLDFHTSGAIDRIGERFDKKAWQRTLQEAAVNSVTTFATCHHGWSYYDTQVGQRHPGLNFDLLRAQYEASKEIDINVPIYLTAGVHNLMAEEHPEWRMITPDGSYAGWTQSPLEAGFKCMSFHSPYLDHLCEQIQEVVKLFPEADGIFLDIISQFDDCSEWALKHMREKGLDPANPGDRAQSKVDALFKYYQRTTEAVRNLNPDMPIFHNSGHLVPGFREILPWFSHLELESLPTGGWGYDHFPLSAKYAHTLGLDYLGMTGKFHTTWGEFGGYKSPNALRYECCAMLAYGAKCSVGDQLHPVGQLDGSTYEIIGHAYREVARKEAFVEGARNVADAAILSSVSTRAAEAFRNKERDDASDTGAARVLLEEHILFDVIDPQADFTAYRMLVLPDNVAVGPELATKLKSYLAAGGKLFLTGDSGIDSESGQMLFDIGGEVGAPSEFLPDYLLPTEALRADFVASPLVMYRRSRRLKVTDGESLGEIYDPYFNRAWDHFCSHQHAPARTEPSGYAGGVRKGNVLYLAHPVFSIYRGFGQVALRQIIGRALRSLLGSDETLSLRGLPSTGRVTLTHQEAEARHILHLLYANTINRGGISDLHGGNAAGKQASYEVIDELMPVDNIEVELRPGVAIRAVTLEPEGEPLAFEQSGDGPLRLRLPRLVCHQMIALQHS
ncbi:beta-galactosidase trimerization domain-containing protein [Ruficoccus amylovorans]|uniref:Beta-galactosidase trimerization domain-containing protein n=1 Tax=Ruficoccus amylovorans TaxID=1804625 RepID=A0A842HGA7_9BACT|nr:beta-galactosidase trimerization domain-containing protein [Ruficoccus amylovorans]MBC2594584.1 beta-galactosidase trimerization domain-containing protein [Ruficoccus amylovorans]